jgi:hypothetical protein
MTTTDTLFNFLTWHTEPQQHFASNYVQTAYNLLTQQGGELDNSRRFEYTG